MKTIDKSQANRWRLLPKISYCNYHKQYPATIGTNAFRRWFSVSRAWSGKIISINVRHHQLSLDFRKNWVADMAH